MISVELIKESRDLEEHRISVNGASFELSIERTPHGPCFVIRDEKLRKLEAYEQEAVIAEMKALARDFESRRLFGSFVPRGRKKR